MRALDNFLSDLAARRIERGVVVMPPRHGKSTLCSLWLPLWWLITWPGARVILTSYEADFAASWGRAVRREIERLTPLDLIPEATQLVEDSTAAHRWDTQAGGGMVTAGVGGPITGRGADLFIIDDPIKNRQEADSQVYRRRLWEWWESTARTRLEPNAVVLLVQTRWHPDDLAGRLIGSGWDTLRLAAIADNRDATGKQGHPDPLGRAPGDALWSERYDVDELRAIERDVGDYTFGALYQGLPIPPEGGGLWNREEMHHARARYVEWDEPEHFHEIVVGVDPPGGRTECGIIVVGAYNDPARRGVVLEDATVPAGEKWGQAVVDAYRRWEADYVIAEGNYGGDMVTQVIEAIDLSVPTTLVHATRGKRVRAEPAHELYEQRLVAHAAGFPHLEDELCRWEPDAGMESPNRMDALVWALQHLRIVGGIVEKVASPFR